MRKASSSRGDPRRTALLSAFRSLVLQRRYDDLKITQIVAHAGVARSTFYEHFHTKDALLLEGLTEPLAPLADAAFTTAPTEALEQALEHLWENRRAVRSMLNGPRRSIVAGRLADLIEARLKVSRDVGAGVCMHLVACQIAGGQLAILTAWVGGLAPCAIGELARIIQATTAATRAAVN